MDNEDQYNDLLSLNFEIHEKGIGTLRANLYRGWFTAPATTRYRFHQSCDDQCDLRLGNTPDQETDVTELLNIDHWSEFRRVSYIAHGNMDRISEWVSLEEG